MLTKTELDEIEHGPGHKPMDLESLLKMARMAIEAKEAFKRINEYEPETMQSTHSIIFDMKSEAREWLAKFEAKE